MTTSINLASYYTFIIAILLLFAYFKINVNGSKYISKYLKNEWNQGKLYSNLAKQLKNHLENIDCSITHNHFHFTYYGLGSELHMWSQALCNSLEKGTSLMQINQTWSWNDQQLCPPDSDYRQPLNCYFNIYNRCPFIPLHHRHNPPVISVSNNFDMCPHWIRDEESRQLFRAASMEYVFSNISDAVINHTDVAIAETFGPKGIQDTENMVTVHIRAGDKVKEMNLVSDQVFIINIDYMIRKNMISDSPTIFVITENTESWMSFQRAVAKEVRPKWKIFRYSYTHLNDTESEKLPAYNAQITGGSSGLSSIISLLIGLEAKYFLLTTGSNWSRLLNELRRNVVDARCGNCTHIIDLNNNNRYGNW